MIYLPFIYFTVLFLIMWRKQKNFNIGSLIVVYYILSSFFAVLIKEFDLLKSVFPDLNLIPTFLYCFLITVSIIPFYNFRSDKIKKINLANKKLFISVSWVLIVFTFISLAFNLKDIINVFSLDFVNIRNELYKNADVFIEFANLPWYKYLINFAPYFSPILLLFFFYSIIYMDNNKVFNILLILSSLVLIANSILSASRTEVIYWIMTFTALFICFSPQMSSKIKRKIKMLFVIIGFFGLIYILTITHSRFGDRGNSSSESLILYAGQSYIQFSNVYNHYSFDELTIDRVLPITSKYVLGHKFNNAKYRSEQSMRIGAETGVFFTFLGDAMLDFGVFGMIIYTFFFFFISISLLRRKNMYLISLSQMVIFVILMRTPLLGLFAYVYTSINSSILLIGSLIIAVSLMKFKKIH